MYFLGWHVTQLSECVPEEGGWDAGHFANQWDPH
jgi:hypothetical protein